MLSTTTCCNVPSPPLSLCILSRGTSEYNRGKVPSGQALITGPFNSEIDPAVDFDVKRAAYFRQMRYGLFVSSATSGSTDLLSTNRCCSAYFRSVWHC